LPSYGQREQKSDSENYSGAKRGPIDVDGTPQLAVGNLPWSEIT
jgi:hypothetical protein